MSRDNAKWTVWVGGSEVNDSLLTETQAKTLVAHYVNLGYDDVVAEEISNGS